MPIPKGAQWPEAMHQLNHAGLSARYEEATDGSEDDALILTRDGQDLPISIQCPNDDTPRGCCFYSVTHIMGEGAAMEFWMSEASAFLLPAIHRALHRIHAQKL